MTEQHAEFLTLLQEKKLTPIFQPIVDLRNGAVVGYEGLIRGPVGTEFHSALRLFHYADQHGLRSQLEFLCCELHLQYFKQLGLTGKLFINASASLLADSTELSKCTVGLLELLDSYEKGSVVIELSEAQPTENLEQLGITAKLYSAYGVQLAIDDLGQGFSSLVLWNELRPAYVKIDRYFIHNIHEDLLKQQLVRSICDVAQLAQATVIAEGIETADELSELRRLGVMCGQGFYLAKPLQSPDMAISQTLEGIFNAPFGFQFSNFSGVDRPISIRRLLRIVPVVDYHTPTNEICERFRDEPDSDTFVVLQAGLPIGMLRRDFLFDRLARPYYRELYGNKPCGDMLERAPLIIDRSTSLHDAGKLVSEGPEHYMTEGFIITRDGQYLGIGSGIELMRELSQLQLRAARYANPLTQLPGNVPINEHIEELLRRNERFAVCYADLDNFKPFNDLYGYRKGDEVIQLTAQLFMEHADKEHDFVGHLGGDDFIMVYRSFDWELRCQRVIQQLTEKLQAFYLPEHLADGGYISENRQRVQVFHPLVAISIGGVEVSSPHLYTAELIAEKATAAKARAKNSLHSMLFVERRQPMAPVQQRTTTQRLDE